MSFYTNTLTHDMPMLLPVLHHITSIYTHIEIRCKLTFPIEAGKVDRDQCKGSTSSPRLSLEIAVQAAPINEVLVFIPKAILRGSYLCFKCAALITIILHDECPLSGQDENCIQCLSRHNLGPCGWMLWMLWLRWRDGGEMTSAVLTQSHSRK